LSASTTVQVDTSPLVAFTISPSSGPVSLNSIESITNLQLSVKGQYADGTFEDLTSSATGTKYQSSGTGNAFVSPSGLVSFFQPGTVYITASRCQMADSRCQMPATSTATFTVSQFSPVYLGQVSINGANNVKADGRCQIADGGCGYVYVTTGGGLSVVSVQSPTAPQVVGTVALNGTAVDLTAPRCQIADGRCQLYVANGVNVAIVDVTTPTAPVAVSTMTTGGNVQAVALSSGCYLPSGICYLYVGDDQGLKIYSLANPAAPSLLGSAAFGGSINGLAVPSPQPGAPSLVYVSRGNQMTVVDVSTPTAPVVEGSLALTSNGIAAGPLWRETIGVFDEA